MQGNELEILGAGISGLSAGVKNGWHIYEAGYISGGICTSYYIAPDGKKYYHREDEETYHFEIGGGHWIFGADKEILSFINSLSQTKNYERNSAVYFPDLKIYVPYPLQNHLFYLPEGIREKALKEIFEDGDNPVSTLTDWLEANFGKTLCELFFFPFHNLYTAGLYKEIEPQDRFKTPVNKDLILKGATQKTPPVGYNAVFAYPKRGLDDLIRKMAGKCMINYGKKVLKIDTKKREVLFEDGSGIRYGQIISTLPLNKVIQMAGIELDGPPAPYTSVLVVNIGAKKGGECPDFHWLYIPYSRSGFHRVGFYSNVDSSFLPLSSRRNNDRVTIYVEKAYKGGEKPKDEEIRGLCNSIVKELREWGFIAELEVIDPTWIEVAYTWQYPGSDWCGKTMEVLKKNQIYQIGRYGKWRFQGIAESVKDGLNSI